ncbi:methylamine dehydrogenase accessory protein MauD [Paucibacter sp. R3-3]|uniref:Methylamine utilization protein MauD n=1 Tax=Roseateles agri TaxID=3098619 RepID=A0ABU5DG19_9BURK|nr:methylamine dehydrogenase accessory protein MauD [Paucibacter sp. R3-3]MDY0745222.1 methylamine dehydrogenase accessory protein MauD [Paucibacter sp. R3-3]
MNDALIISNIVLWIAVLALLLVVLALSRQIGILYERIAPMGALMMDSGPKVGEAAPRFELATLGGSTVTLGGAKPKSTLVFFLSPTCPVCKKLLPILKSVRKAEAQTLDIVLASDGDRPEHDEFRQRAGLADFPYVLSSELGLKYQISKLPYAVLLDSAGRISAKGLINSREQLDSLFAARDLGVASVQDYLDHGHTHAHPEHA